MTRAREEIKEKSKALLSYTRKEFSAPICARAKSIKKRIDEVNMSTDNILWIKKQGTKAQGKNEYLEYLETEKSCHQSGQSRRPVTSA